VGEGFGGWAPSLGIERSNGSAEVERVPVGDGGSEQVEPGSAVGLALAGAIAELAVGSDIAVQSDGFDTQFDCEVADG